MQACLAGAAVFVVVGLVLLAVSAAAAGRSRRLAEDAARRRAAMEASASPLTDARLILLAVQIAQTIGFRRILPLLALGGAAFAVATRSRAGADGVDAKTTRAPRSDYMTPTSARIEKDHEKGPEAARGVVTPAGAVGPSRQSPDQKQAGQNRGRPHDLAARSRKAFSAAKPRPFRISFAR